MKGRKILFIVITTLLVIALPIIVIELFFRAFDPFGARYYFETARYFRNVSPDPDIGYLTKPGLESEFDGVKVITNSDGLRWQEVRRKKSDTKRILVLGDSLVFGWGVEQENIFPSQLQVMIDEAGHSVEVVSAGVCSWNTRMEYEFLKKKGLKYEPDTIVLVVMGNDVKVNASGQTEIDREEFYLQLPEPGWKDSRIKNLGRAAIHSYRSYLLVTLVHFAKIETGRREITRLYAENTLAWEDARLALQGIIDTCRENNIRLIVYLWGSEEEEFLRISHSKYRSVLQENSIDHHLFPGKLFDRRYRNSGVDPHPNAAGHRIMAADIFPVIFED